MEIFQIVFETEKTYLNSKIIIIEIAELTIAKVNKSREILGA
jgi:hypothetical protein